MNDKERDLLADIDKLNKTIEGMEMTSRMLVRRDIDLRRAYDNLKSLDREKTEFVSIAAHQLRTPVTTARWATKELKQKISSTLPAEHLLLLDRAADSVERIFNLTEDLLELNRIDFGNTHIHPVPSSVEKLIESICQDHEPQIEKRSINLIKKYATETKVTKFDPARMRDALDNLIDNAIKYTPIGGTVSVETSYSDTEVTIKVSDTGIGIERGLEDKIFQKFTRLGNAEAVDPNGIGLGLYVTKSFIEKHNGSIEYSHNSPGGSIFTIKIPC